jgi:exodeoxyribonuclease-3
VKIATWNINSIRARLDRLLAWLDSARPDVLCLQELKCTDDQFPRLEVEAKGYRVEVYGQKTYNGVALLSREAVTGVHRGLGDGDEQARVIAATVQGVHVVGVYAPNGQSVDSPAYGYKLEWYGKLNRWLKATFPAGEPLLVCGDLNVAPDVIDVWDPALFEGQTLFTDQERAALKAVQDDNALVDLFRTKHPEPGRYSWWDYRQLGFPKNHGLRIDHVLVNAPLVARCTAVDIDREARKGKLPSDHAPVWAEFS